MLKSTKTFTAAAVFAAGLAAAPVHAQDSTESGSGAMMEGEGMMAQDGTNGMMGDQGGMTGMMNMMTQMNEMMMTCNKMMQAMMDSSGKGMSGSQDATPEKDG